MQSLRSRFIFTHILPTLLVVPLATVGLLYLIETQLLLNDLSADVAAQAGLIGELLAENSAVWQDGEQAQTFVVRVSEIVAGDVVLVSPDGQVLAASDPAVGDTIVIAANGRDTAVTYTFFTHSAKATVEVLDLEEQLLGYVRVNSALAETSQQFTRLRQMLILSVLLELIVGAAIGAYLAARMAQPITAATTAISEIAHHERVDPVPETGAQEIQTLAYAVNILAARLRELETSRRKLLANLVHELGRPLGAMAAAINVLRDGGDEDPELRQELLKGIEDHIYQMQPLLDDLAQLGGQVLGTRELIRQPMSLNDWLPALLLPWRAAAQEKGLTWQTDIAAHLPILNIDPDRIAQAIGNLVSNAIKYTPAGGTVTVTAVATTQTVQIIIQDTGPGIAPDEHEKIFEPLFRSSRETRFPQGMGLGLTIARDLIEAHDGAIILKSTPGNGSAFTISLPI
ncbi:MAG: HAMP domain-containing histidine kinase [Chloroflexi bacterium]|nr:HAMP domain-containing histidine kinase [Chloroflexota bacterium]